MLTVLCMQAVLLPRVATGRMDMTDDFTISSFGSTRRPKTLQMKSAEGRLIQALDNLRLSTPAEPFAGRFQLLSERVTGGQALVQVCVLLFVVHCAGANKLNSKRWLDPVHMQQLQHGIGAVPVARLTA